MSVRAARCARQASAQRAARKHAMALKTMRDEHGDALKQTREEQAAAVERQDNTSAELEQAQRELQELQVLVAVGTCQHLCAR
jgi:hypothetical protein